MLHIETVFTFYPDDLELDNTYQYNSFYTKKHKELLETLSLVTTLVNCPLSIRSLGTTLLVH